MRLLILIITSFFVYTEQSKKLIELQVGTYDNDFFFNIKNISSTYEQTSLKIMKLLHINDQDFKCKYVNNEDVYVFSLWFSLGMTNNIDEIANYIADEIFYKIYWRILSPFYNYPYTNITLVETSIFRTRWNIENKDIKYHIARVCTMPYAGDKLLPIRLCEEWSEFYKLLKKNSYKNESNSLLLKSNTDFYLHVNKEKFDKWITTLYL